MAQIVSGQFKGGLGCGNVEVAFAVLFRLNQLIPLDEPVLLFKGQLLGYFQCCLFPQSFDFRFGQSLLSDKVQSLHGLQIEFLGGLQSGCVLKFGKCLNSMMIHFTGNAESFIVSQLVSCHEKAGLGAGDNLIAAESGIG